MDVEKMKKLGVPEEVVKEFNRNLDEYIKDWIAAIDEHHQKLHGKKDGGADEGKNEADPSGQIVRGKKTTGPRRMKKYRPPPLPER